MDPLAGRFANAGHEVTAIRPEPIGGETIPELMEGVCQNVKYYYLSKYSRSYSLITRFKYLIEMIRMVKRVNEKEDYDIIRAISLMPGYAAVRAKQGLKTKVVTNLSDFYSDMYGLFKLPLAFGVTRFLRKIEEKVVRESDLLFVDSPTQREYWVNWGLNAKKCSVVPNPILPEVFNPKVEGQSIRKKHNIQNAKIILYQGDISELDGIETLILAAQDILREINNAIFMIVGSGYNRYIKELVNLVHKKGLSDSFIFTGWVPYTDVPKYIAAADVGVAPFKLSLTSNSNIMYKVTEYLSCGKPVVASRSNGLVEMLGNKISLVNPDDKNALANRLVEVLRDHDFTRKTKGRLKTFHERITYDAVANHQEVLMRHVMDDKCNDYRIFDYSLN